MPSRKRTSIDAPLASGVASVTVPADIDELKPPPFGCDGGCSSVVPLTVTLLVPLPHGGRSTVTTTAVDVRGRKSAMPLGAGNVVTSITRKRKRGRFEADTVDTAPRALHPPTPEPCPLPLRDALPIQPHPPSMFGDASRQGRRARGTWSHQSRACVFA